MTLMLMLLTLLLLLSLLLARALVPPASRRVGCGGQQRLAQHAKLVRPSQRRPRPRLPLRRATDRFASHSRSHARERRPLLMLLLPTLRKRHAVRHPRARSRAPLAHAHHTT